MRSTWVCLWYHICDVLYQLQAGFPAFPKNVGCSCQMGCLRHFCVMQKYVVLEVACFTAYRFTGCMYSSEELMECAWLCYISNKGNIDVAKMHILGRVSGVGCAPGVAFGDVQDRTIRRRGPWPGGPRLSGGLPAWGQRRSSSWVFIGVPGAFLGPLWGLPGGYPEAFLGSSGAPLRPSGPFAAFQERSSGPPGPFCGLPGAFLKTFLRPCWRPHGSSTGLRVGQAMSTTSCLQL